MIIPTPIQFELLVICSYNYPIDLEVLLWYTYEYDIVPPSTTKVGQNFPRQDPTHTVGCTNSGLKSPCLKSWNLDRLQLI